MARAVQEVEGESLLVGEMPHGCRLCANGSKMVLFVTGLCDSGCFYCPLSQEKSNEDVTYADEMIVGNEGDILTESESIGAEGAGLSGGDPLCTLERTLDYMALLKNTHGGQFHIHLYTSQADVESEVLKQLRDAGLDEIRFHLGRVERTQALSHNIVLAVSEHPLRTFAPEGNLAFSIRGHDGIIGGIEDLSKVFLRLLQGGKHLVICLHQLRELKLTGHVDGLGEIAHCR